MGGCLTFNLFLLDGRIGSRPKPEMIFKLIIEHPDAGLARPHDFET